MQKFEEKKNKTVAIMQPYLFPYIGYWQLINAVDTFVLYDDVNFIKRGYINRNSILLNGKPYLFSIPVEKLSQNKLIKDTKLKFTTKDKENFLRTITLAYQKAPYYKDFYPILQDIVMNENNDLTNYIKYSIEKIIAYLNINTNILVSSQINKNMNLKGEERIIEINKQLNTSCYINAIGGRNLYKYEDFAKEDIKLYFIKTLDYSYNQFGNNFISDLSIIDVLMFNSNKEAKKLISNYRLI